MWISYPESIHRLMLRRKRIKRQIRLSRVYIPHIQAWVDSIHNIHSPYYYYDSI